METSTGGGLGKMFSRVLTGQNLMVSEYTLLPHNNVHTGILIDCCYGEVGAFNRVSSSSRSSVDIVLRVKGYHS